jgi:two-component sensor histidine kinase
MMMEREKATESEHRHQAARADGGAPGESETLAGTVVSRVRHGVANSLQMLVSLMQIRGFAVENTDVRRELDELASRVHGVATVYRAVELRDGALDVPLRRVLDELCALHRNAAPSLEVRLFCDDREFRMALEETIPLAVLTSEIIAAAVRRDRQAGGGVIDVILTRSEAQRIQLAFVDDGFVLPHAAEPSPGGSLGWLMVSAMARQIGGTLERGADDRRITLTVTPRGCG